MMLFRVGDFVEIDSGEHKGKIGHVVYAFPETTGKNKYIVKQALNMQGFRVFEDELTLLDDGDGFEVKCDEINKAPHYNQHPSGVECIDVIEHFSANLSFATKYIWRQGLKPDNDAVKDLRKALYYVDREIKRLEKKANG